MKKKKIDPNILEKNPKDIGRCYLPFYIDGDRPDIIRGERRPHGGQAGKIDSYRAACVGVSDYGDFTDYPTHIAEAHRLLIVTACNSFFPFVQLAYEVAMLEGSWSIPKLLRLIRQAKGLLKDTREARQQLLPIHANAKLWKHLKK